MANDLNFYVALFKAVCSAQQNKYTCFRASNKNTNCRKQNEIGKQVVKLAIKNGKDKTKYYKMHCGAI